ncbi:D-2-hydroxyacid dehydrogenase family protein [Pusillimonas sp. TS35]|nr:D-2-hydroxyacid dehydrogenase family protein [Pusillimonas sp. TS35]
MTQPSVAIIDDYQNVALTMADWGTVARHARIQVFTQAWQDEDDLVRQLEPFEIISLIRERTAFPERVLVRLPRLKLISMTGARTTTLDIAACTRLGIPVAVTGGSPSHAAAEMAVALILACARGLPQGERAMRTGGWQNGVPMGIELEGKQLGIVGLGKLGSRVARVGQALGMDIVAWSQNLTPDRAADLGVRRVEKDELFSTSDVVSVHLTLSPRTEGIIGAHELGLMKQGAIIVNTARGPLVDEAALLQALGAGRIVAGLDVYDIEPLPVDHPLRTLPNVVLSPHLGYVVASSFEHFFRENARNIATFLEGGTPKLMNPEVMAGRIAGER